MVPTVRRSLAPRGQTPILRAPLRREKISAISAITISPKRRRLGLYFKLLPDNDNVHATDIVRFLRDLKGHLPRPLTIVWDRSNVHDRSTLVRRYLAKHPEIITEKFPGYAPELNPDEGVWSHTKYARLANYVPTDTRELRSRVAAELLRLRKLPRLLASLIRHTKLPLLL